MRIKIASTTPPYRDLLLIDPVTLLLESNPVFLIGTNVFLIEKCLTGNILYFKSKEKINII